jgi:GNAT superfamily N-acetyltransferase
MLDLLSIAEVAVARPLFAELGDHLIVQAVLDGTSPGQVYVDDRRRPAVAFISSAEGHYLAGSPDHRAFNDALRDMLATTIFAGDDDAFVVFVQPDAWAGVLAGMLPHQPLLTDHRRHYVCRAVRDDGLANLPAHYTIERIDAALLARSDLQLPGHIFSWMRSNWGSTEAFLQRGFGFCMLHETSVVCWCLADCVHGDRSEIGIRTAPAYQRRGLATCTVAATVSYALSQGFSEVGWHCSDTNIGSWKTAERVGFTQTSSYIEYYCLVEPWRHRAQSGWVDIQAGRYAEGLACYEAVFAGSDIAQPYDYHRAARAAAALGDTAQALRYLDTAIEQGWTDRQHTSSCAEFASLHATAEWAALLARLG